jgi:3'-5' exoribonuclease
MFHEALMLHYLDDLDSKMESMRAHFEREPDAEWTGYNASLGRTLLNSERVLAKIANSQAPMPETAPEPAEQIVMKAVAGDSE